MFRDGPELEQKSQNRSIYGHIADKSRKLAEDGWQRTEDSFPHLTDGKFFEKLPI